VGLKHNREPSDKKIGNLAFWAYNNHRSAAVKGGGAITLDPLVVVVDVVRNMFNKCYTLNKGRECSVA